MQLSYGDFLNRVACHASYSQLLFAKRWNRLPIHLFLVRADLCRTKAKQGLSDYITDIDYKLPICPAGQKTQPSQLLQQIRQYRK